jgi:ankyrin repeat protein
MSLEVKHEGKTRFIWGAAIALTVLIALFGGIYTARHKIFYIAMLTKNENLIKLILFFSPELAHKSIHKYENSMSEAILLTKDINIIKLFLQHGAQINDERGRPLSTAIVVGDRRIINFLLSQGAKVNSYHLTAAIEYATPDIVDLMILNGANVNEALLNASYGHSHRTGHPNSIDVIKILLSKGANLNIKEGRALISAIMAEQPEIVEYLLENGLDIRVCHDNALESATNNLIHGGIGRNRKKSMEIINILIKHGARLNMFSQWRRARIEKIFADEGVPLETPTSLAP